MSFNIFDSSTTDSIRVAYISTDRGLVDDVSVCQANDYAKLNPGTQFIFRNRKYIKYLNINEVNQLTPDDAVVGITTCEGLQLTSECPPPAVYFYGGGGVGVQGNPVFGNDGSLLAVDLVSGGFGYQYPPIVEVKDGCGFGAGAVVRAVLGEVVETVEVYDQEADFEEYEICDPTDVVYGKRYGPNGEDLGDWDPTLYANLSKDPIRREIQQYQDFLQKKANPWWTTRKAYAPLKLTSSAKITRTKFDVTDSSHLELIRKRDNNPSYTAWNDFMNSYAISPVPPSNLSGSDFAGIPFTFEWEEDFPYDGEYVFRGLCDNKAEFYLDNLKIANLGPYNGAVTPIYKTLKAGVHRIRLDLLNEPIYETKVIPSKVENQVAGADFILKSDGYYLIVGGNVETEVTLSLIWKDDPNSYGIAISKAIIPNPDGEPIVLEKNKEDGNWATRGNVSAKSVFKVNKEYGPITFVDTQRTPRLANRNTFYGPDSNRYDKIEFFDGGGDDVNGSIQIIEAKNLQPNRIISQPTPNTIQTKVVFNTIDYINKANRRLWRTNVYGRGGFLNDYGICPFDTSVQLEDNPYAGIHKIVWNNINFPVDGNYIIELEVDDNVTLKFTGSSTETIITKKGFSNNDQGTGKSTETKYFKAGNYTISADLEQIPGGKFGFGAIKGINPMALAINIQTSFTETEVVSSKTWNENPMGVSFTIDAPAPPIPQEPIPLQEGRCPNNPIWSTRFPGASQAWYPVNFNGWSKFFNRYALSPVPPSSSVDSDHGGATFRNSWNVEIPYRGYYKIQGEVDDIAKIYIDGKLSLDLSRRMGKTNGSEKVLIEKGNHTISVEVTNYTSETFSQVKKKIFSTHDWGVAPVITQKEEQKAGSLFVREGNQYYMLAGGNDIVEIDFVLDWKDDPGTAGLAVKRLLIDTEKGPLIFDRPLVKTGSIANTGTFKANKKYAITIEGRAEGSLDPVIVDTGTSPESKQQRINLFDGDGADVNAKFTAINARQLSGPRTIQTSVPILEKGGVTYQGPPLVSYNNKYWNEYLNSNGLAPLIPGESPDASGRKKFTWTNVTFSESGQYDVKFIADNNADLYIGGIKVLNAESYGTNPQTFNINVTKGTYNIVIDSEYPYTNPETNTSKYFEENPTGFALEITKNVTVSTGHSKPWTENPIGISAILIPPPCPKKIKGKGVVTNVIVDDPGNGYPLSPDAGAGYPVILKLAEVIVENPGINYNCGVDQLKITPDFGCNLSYTCDSFGRIRDVTVNSGCSGFTSYPEIVLESETGTNASFRPVFEIVRDPLTVDDGKKLIQVTDLVGLKQTGYVDGRAYYGAVFYENGVKYAGYYKTVGTPTRVYDTLQESITAKVTTPASAIERSGTDVTSNDPRLNIPGTPQNLI
jgi:hypothetical protein